MRFLYNVLFLIGFALSTPYYFWRMKRRGNWRKGFAQRFATYDARLKTALTNRHVLWIHAVSVGEVNVATHLIRALEIRAPSLALMVSTTTTTGMAELEKKLPLHIPKIYYPIDRRKYVSRAMRVINPEAIVLVEAEIWPNFLWKARDRRVPVFLVNARMSDRSYRGYKRFGFLFRPLFASFAGVGAQNEADVERLKNIGARPDRIHMVGNLKFDAAKLEERPSMDVETLFKQIGVAADAQVIVAGSTHSGEEAILAGICLRLKLKFPKLFLVLVPRHFERGKEAGRDIEAAGARFVYRTELGASSRFSAGELDCLLVNTTGELRYFYAAATVIFVGKSLTAEGGQNPIEPGALGKPMIYGPNMQNFKGIADVFVSEGGAIQVPDEAGLEKALEQLLSDAKLRASLGANALRVVRENQGSIERTVAMIIDTLPVEVTGAWNEK